MQNIDVALKSFDYSLLSAARERLLQRLLTMRRNRKNSIVLLNNLMTDDELDCVAAAGGTNAELRMRNSELKAN